MEIIEIWNIWAVLAWAWYGHTSSIYQLVWTRESCVIYCNYVFDSFLWYEDVKPGKPILFNLNLETLKWLDFIYKWSNTYQFYRKIIHQCGGSDHHINITFLWQMLLSRLKLLWQIPVPLTRVDKFWFDISHCKC